MKNQLNNSEKIISLLDGELNPADSSQLYNDMASDIELQEEMNQQISLKNVINKNNSLPPSALKNEIAQKIGIYSEPLYKSRYLSYLATLLFGGLISFFTFNFFQDKNISNTIQENQPIYSSSKPIDIEIITPLPNEYSQKSVNNSQDYNKSNKNTNLYTPKPEYNSIPNETSIENTGVNYINNSNDITQSEIVNYQDVNENTITPQTYSNSQFALFSDINNNSVNQNYKKSKFTFIINKFQDHSITNVGVSPIINPTINNLSVALMYNYNDNWQFGLEYGQEYFNQRFYSQENFVKHFIDQIYLSNWIGVNSRYLSNNFDTYFAPQVFAKALLAYSEAGPISKLETGLVFNLNNRLSFSTGFQYSNLLYTYKSQFFHSNKIGLNAGLNIKF